MRNDIKNLKEAAERIKTAAQNKENIILYGDSDLDGIASAVILKEAIQNLGGEVSMVLFPDRENDGYGVNLKALEFLKDKAPALLVTLDLGIANVKEVDIANGMGFEVIIVDHHEILESLPNAKVIVDPQQKDDGYPFKGLANAGVTLKLCQEILRDALSENVNNSFLELTALATIADMVPQVEDNKMFIEQGLRSLQNTFRPGLRAFLDLLGLGEVATGGYMKIISALNAAESLDFKNDSYELLTSPSAKRCRELAEHLLARARQKQERIREAVEEVERHLSQKLQESIIFEGDPAWRLTIAGPVASIIAQAHEKPTFIFKKGEAESCGSVRSFKEGRDSVEAMKACKDFLLTYGGHPKASGFRIRTEHLERFKNCLVEHFKKNS